MDRPLPYLIGSQAFMEQDDVGLGDLSSDGMILFTASLSAGALYSMLNISHMYMIVCPEMSVDSDRDSVLESEDGKEAVVRQFFFSFTAFFKVFSFFSVCTGKKNTYLFYLIIHLTAFR